MNGNTVWLACGDPAAYRLLAIAGFTVRRPSDPGLTQPGVRARTVRNADYYASTIPGLEDEETARHNHRLLVIGPGLVLRTELVMERARRYQAVGM
jgi:hypothetical protein